MDLVKIVTEAVEKAERGESKLPEIFPDENKQYSLSGYKGRALINNICANEGINYREVGSYAGSTLCSALYGNKIKAVACDLWEAFIEQPRATIVKNLFIERVSRYKGENDVKVLQADIYHADTAKAIGPGFNFYFFDGDHTAIATEMAIIAANPCMEKEFILMVDDYAMVTTRKGIENAMNEMGYEKLFWRELGQVPQYDWYLDYRDASQPDWWCNYLIAVLRKP